MILFVDYYYLRFQLVQLLIISYNRRSDWLNSTQMIMFFNYWSLFLMRSYSLLTLGLRSRASNPVEGFKGTVYTFSRDSSLKHPMYYTIANCINHSSPDKAENLIKRSAFRSISAPIIFNSSTYNLNSIKIHRQIDD